MPEQPDFNKIERAAMMNITLPADEVLKKQLEGKLEEYRARQPIYAAKILEKQGLLETAKGRMKKKIDQEKLARYRNSLKENGYRIFLLARLLEKGTIDLHEISQEIHGLQGKEEFDPLLWVHACEIIREYVSSGGKNLEGGTGLQKE